MRNLIEEARICHGEHTTHGKFIQKLADHAERLEAKLAKAVRLISEKPILATYEDDVQWQKYVIAELTGGKDA